MKDAIDYTTIRKTDYTYVYIEYYYYVFNINNYIESTVNEVVSVCNNYIIIIYENGHDKHQTSRSRKDNNHVIFI